MRIMALPVARTICDPFKKDPVKKLRSVMAPEESRVNEVVFSS